MELTIGVLGPVVAELGGRPVALGTTRQRALLALLALEAGHVVPIDRIVDALWDDDVPARGDVGPLVCVEPPTLLEPDRPRRTTSRVLLTGGTGYMLDLGADAVDSSRFETHARRARARPKTTATLPRPSPPRTRP